MLIDYGHASLYPDLLTLLGCAQLNPERVEHHLCELARTFDAAAAAAKTPFFFSTDITSAARPIAVGIKVFWIVATLARCHAILAADAPPELRRTLAPAFDAVVADLGIASTDDLVHRADDVTQFLPKLRETTSAILGDASLEV